MEYCIIISFVLALWHFVYESIILPNFRLKFRYDLFKIRDALVMHEHEFGRSAALNVLYNSLNTSLKYMHSFNLYDLVKSVQFISENKDALKQVEKRRELIDNSDQSLKSFSEEITKINSSVFALNLGSWIPLALPAYYLIDIIKKIFGVPYWIYNSVRMITFSKDEEIKYFIPLSVRS
jgi:hypothetical protein